MVQKHFKSIHNFFFIKCCQANVEDASHVCGIDQSQSSARLRKWHTLAHANFILLFITIQAENDKKKKKVSLVTRKNT